MTVTATVASALGTDLLSPQALNRGLPRLNAMTWVAGGFGFAGAGLVIDALGDTTLYLASAGLAIFAALLVLELRPRPVLAAETPQLTTRTYQECHEEAVQHSDPCPEMV